MTIRKLKISESDFLPEMLYEAIFIPEGQAFLQKGIYFSQIKSSNGEVITRKFIKHE